MNLTRGISLKFFVISILIFILAIETKNFGILTLGVTSLFVSLALKVKQRYELFVPIISLLLAISLCEFILSIKGFFDRKTFYADGTGYTEKYGLKINGNGYNGNAGEYPFKMLTRDGEIIYDVIYTIGEDGFRRDVTSAEKNVYIYGGSFVFGEGLNDDETLSHFLNTDHGIKSKGWEHRLKLIPTIKGGMNGSKNS